MKKSLLWMVVLILSVSVVVGFSLAGCKTTTAAETTAAETTVAETTAAETTVAETTATVVKKAGLSVMFSGAPTPAAEAQLALFTKKTGINILVEVVPGGDQGATLLKARIISGNMPDIIRWHTGAPFSELDPGKNFVDISNEPFVASLTDDFKKAAMVNGKLYGVPASAGEAVGIVYNRKIYKDLGLEIPKTWAQFLDNANKAKAAGYIAVVGTYADAWSAQGPLLADFYNLNAVLPDFAANYTANKAHFADTPDALKGFQRIADLKDLMNKDLLTTTFATGQQMLGEGKAVHWPMFAGIFQAMNPTYPDVVKNDLGFFPQPGDDPNNNGFTTWAPGEYYITKSAKDLESAKAFLAFMTSQEAYDAFAAVEAISGPLAVKGITLPSNKITEVFATIRTEIQKYIDEGKSSPALEFLSPLKGPNLPQICVEVGSGTMTAAEGAAEYDKDVKKLAEQLKLPGW